MASLCPFNTFTKWGTQSFLCLQIPVVIPWFFIPLSLCQCWSPYHKFSGLLDPRKFLSPLPPSCDFNEATAISYRSPQVETWIVHASSRKTQDRDWRSYLLCEYCWPWGWYRLYDSRSRLFTSNVSHWSTAYSRRWCTYLPPTLLLLVKFFLWWSIHDRVCFFSLYQSIWNYSPFYIRTPGGSQSVPSLLMILALKVRPFTEPVKRFTHSFQSKPSTTPMIIEFLLNRNHRI